MRRLIRWEFILQNLQNTAARQCSQVWTALSVSQKLRWAVPNRVCFISEKDSERARVQGLSSEATTPEPHQSPSPLGTRGEYLVLCDSLLWLLSLYSRLMWVAHSPRSRGMLSGVTWSAASVGYTFPWQFWENEKQPVRQKEEVSAAEPQILGLMGLSFENINSKAT